MASSRHGDDKLVAYYADPAYVDAVDSLAKAQGVSRAGLIRAAVLRWVLGESESHASTSIGGDRHGR